MDGAGVSSGSPVPLQAAWLCFTIQPGAGAVDKAAERMSLGLPRSPAPNISLPIMSAVINRTWQCQGLCSLEILEVFFGSLLNLLCPPPPLSPRLSLPVRSTVYSPQGDKVDTASGWMYCSGESPALSLPLNPAVALETIKYLFDGGTLYEDESRFPLVMAI